MMEHSFLRRMARGVAAAAVVTSAALAVPQPAAAQTPPLPPPGTSANDIQQQIDALGLREQLLTRIRTSGLSPEEIRRRLAAMGYDPATLDPYLTDTVPLPSQASTDVLSAARALSMTYGTESDSLDAGLTDLLEQPSDSVRADLPESWSEAEIEAGLPIFGREVFGRSTTEFVPDAVGPVPPTYRLGPGDELVLLITGGVEFGYTLPVTREGFIVIPQVGQVWVNGLTLAQLRERLYRELGEAYSGIRQGPEATTFFDVSLARLRTSQIYIAGEVNRPGSYVVSPVATVLSVLYNAGGPNPNGSFRDVRIMRGGEVAARVDLYDYLLTGDNLSDVRLQPGDVVFVPPQQGRVALRGEVQREALYEILPGETIADLVRYAGGVQAVAGLRRARITRILPPAQRTEPGVDRVVFDVGLAEALATPEEATVLLPGDEVQIFDVRSEVRNVVSLEGGVWHEGTFGYRPGMTAWDLIRKGEGLRPDAYLARANIMRLDPSDSTIAVIPFSLERGADGNPVDDPALREFDVLRVFSKADFTESYPISIEGEVIQPLEVEFQEGMTLRDMILRAGGLKPTADLMIEVARLANPESRQDGQVVEVIRIPADSSYFVSERSGRYYLGDREVDREAFEYGPPGEFELRPYDRIFVRRLPNFEFPRAVSVQGEVRYPGEYVLSHREARLRDLIVDRAGGLTPSAFDGGFRFYREGERVNVDLAAVLENARHRDNLVLLPGDSMYVPEYNPVVTVKGAVNAPATVLYREGADLDYYIANAGGYRADADEERVHVRYANGSGRATREILFINFDPKPGPGSEVTVPAVSQEDKFDWSSTIGDVAQVVASLGTIITVIVTTNN